MAAESLSVEQYLQAIGAVKPLKLGAPDEPEKPPGELVCEGVIVGHAVPWKAPTIGRNGGAVQSRDYKRYKSWQKDVASQAKRLMRRRRPYGGPVQLDVTFFLTPRPGKYPDRSNLLKAFEDSLEGVIYQNDNQVARGHTARVISAQESERVEFRVTAIQGGDA